MPFQFFPQFCPETAKDETWRFTLPHAQRGLPAGDYVFLERYCDEVGCDCRRVWLTVVRCEPGRGTGDPTGPLATIGFGWEAPAFYQQWSPGDPEAMDLAGARLEPFQPQGSKAEMILDMTKKVILSPPENVRKIQRHYAAVRKVVQAKA